VLTTIILQEAQNAPDASTNTKTCRDMIINTVLDVISGYAGPDGKLVSSWLEVFSFHQHQ